jgi:cysteine-rich repeat protein
MLEGTTVGFGPAPMSDCVATGPALTLGLRVETTGVLEVDVEGSALFRVSILGACDDPETLACGLGHASARVTAGDRVFARVAGLEPMDAGELTLTVRSRPADVCGDGYRDPAERCDDGNDEAGDGCDASCHLEATEVEDNSAISSASAYSEPFYAEIAPAGDEDLVVLDLEGDATLVAETLDLGDASCATGALDSLLELLDASGDPLAFDDDGGVGYCARLVVPDLRSGRYVLRVAASPDGAVETFPYRLRVSVEP